MIFRHFKYSKYALSHGYVDGEQSKRGSNPIKDLVIQDSDQNVSACMHGLVLQANHATRL